MERRGCKRPAEAWSPDSKLLCNTPPLRSGGPYLKVPRLAALGPFHYGAVVLAIAEFCTPKEVCALVQCNSDFGSVLRPLCDNLKAEASRQKEALASWLLSAESIFNQILGKRNILDIPLDQYDPPAYASNWSIELQGTSDSLNNTLLSSLLTRLDVSLENNVSDGEEDVLYLVLTAYPTATTDWSKIPSVLLQLIPPALVRGEMMQHNTADHCFPYRTNKEPVAVFYLRVGSMAKPHFQIFAEWCLNVLHVTDLCYHVEDFQNYALNCCDHSCPGEPFDEFVTPWLHDLARWKVWYMEPLCHVNKVRKGDATISNYISLELLSNWEDWKVHYQLDDAHRTPSAEETTLAHDNLACLLAKKCATPMVYHTRKDWRTACINLGLDAAWYDAYGLSVVGRTGKIIGLSTDMQTGQVLLILQDMEERHSLPIDATLANILQ